MENLLLNLIGHNDLGIHVIGWLVTVIVAVFTLLYKGIWKRINQQDAENTSTRDELNKLIGAHNHMAIMCGGHTAVVERRKDPERPTIIGYVPLEEEDP